MLRSKKASVPITILVIGIFLVCALAIFSFMMTRAKLKHSFDGVDLMEKMNYQIENYFVDKNFGEADTKILGDGSKAFYQEKLGSSGWWLWKKEWKAFSAEYKVAQ